MTLNIGYLKDPTMHDVENTNMHKYHALKDGTKNLAHCNERVHLELDTETNVDDIGTHQMCGKCKANLMKLSNM